ncbi:MAG: hypothetical protein V4808_12460 [Pseudomonadota bacterium]
MTTTIAQPPDSRPPANATIAIAAIGVMAGSLIGTIAMPGIGTLIGMFPTLWLTAIYLAMREGGRHE